MKELIEIDGVLYHVSCLPKKFKTVKATKQINNERQKKEAVKKESEI